MFSTGREVHYTKHSWAVKAGKNLVSPVRMFVPCSSSEQSEVRVSTGTPRYMSQGEVVRFAL